MPGQTIGTTLGFGYPGTTARESYALKRARIVKPTDTVNVNFGDPVVLNSDGTVSKFASASTAAEFSGVAVREVKQATEYPATGYPYLPGQVCDVQETGDIVVTCVEGTPAPGGAVYVATSAGTNVAIGDFCATATPAGGASTVHITSAAWDSVGVDANSVAVITLLQRVNP